MNDWLPLVFVFLMALSMLIYVVLDGYDLGVGILMRRANDAQKDEMVSSIGPFWDANETWLVLGVGILLVAFPAAHGVILGGLYLPVALMLAGLILRGVAFDFRSRHMMTIGPGGIGRSIADRCWRPCRRDSCWESTCSGFDTASGAWPLPGSSLSRWLPVTPCSAPPG